MRPKKFLDLFFFNLFRALSIYLDLFLAVYGLTNSGWVHPSKGIFHLDTIRSIPLNRADRTNTLRASE
jgi:hypothetical protein